MAKPTTTAVMVQDLSICSNLRSPRKRRSKNLSDEIKAGPAPHGGGLAGDVKPRRAGYNSSFVFCSAHFRSDPRIFFANYEERSRGSRGFDTHGYRLSVTCWPISRSVKDQSNKKRPTGDHG